MGVALQLQSGRQGLLWRQKKFGGVSDLKFMTAAYQWGVTDETVSQLCQQGQLAEAVEALGVLVQTDCGIAQSLLRAVIKKCEIQRNLVVGRRVHALIVMKGYEPDMFLCNHIMRMYAAHARLAETMDVFTVAAKPDAFMWSSVISAHVNHGQAEQAVQLYQQMRRSGVKPDGHVFVAALQACARGADLSSGQQVHADVLASGVEPSLFVCNSLVDMYAKCGSLEDAQRVFDGLGRRDVVTWTSLIAGYSQHGMGQTALRVFRAMQDEGMAAPDSATFVCLLQACASLGTPALENGKQLHQKIREEGLQADVFVASSLVNMYTKCGRLDKARGVFDRLGHKNVVTWNAMIAGYSQQGMGQEALDLHNAMQQEVTVLPDSVTFLCLLQACASVGTPALGKGKQLHLQIRERGLLAGVCLSSSLINMYAKCGSLEDARGVFDGVGQKNVVIWNAMIGGYSQQGVGQEALVLYRAMQEEGIVAPDAVTFVSLLQACASEGTPALETGKQLHAQIEDKGFQADVFVSNSLVNMYLKCGSLEDALIVFNGLGQKNVVTWNAMIAGYFQQGMGQKALNLHSAMQDDGIAVPDSVTFLCLLQACASVGTPALEKGKQLHSQIKNEGLLDDMCLANTLVHMYAKCGSLEDAQSIFDELGQKSVGTWATLIAGYAQQGLGQEALSLHCSMHQEGISASDSVTFMSLLQACASVGSPALETGRQLHAQIREQGLDTDVFIASSLVNMYAKCGSLEDAQSVFDGLGEKNVVTWSAMIAGYSQQGRGQEALRLYEAMQEEGIVAPNSVTYVCLLQACTSLGTLGLEKGKQLHAQIKEQGLEADVFLASSLVTMYANCGTLEDARGVFDGLPHKDVGMWNAMIAGYSKQGMGQEALRLYSAMQNEGIVAPDSLTFVCLLQACANVAALHVGRQLHAQIEEQGLHTDVLVAGSLINMYGKSGSMVDAQQVFEALPGRDDVACNALIAGYTRQGDSEVVFDLFERMRRNGIQPTAMTFLSVLTVCNHVGLVSKGREYFQAMSEEHGIRPSVEHYTCMVDLLGRAGHVDEALAFIKTIPVLPSAAVWHALLGACQKWNSVEVGQHAFDEAVKLDHMDASAYVLMSNIYTGAQMWEQAQEMQARRKGIGAWKQPGQSWWTDLDGLVHCFFVGDAKHPESKNIYARLEQLCSRTKDLAHLN